MAQPIKCMIIGETDVGKTAWVSRLAGRGHERKHIATVGCEVARVERDGRDIHLWDTAGDYRFGGLRDGYMMGADCAVILYDDRLRSRERAVLFAGVFQAKCPGAPYVYAHNKSDLGAGPALRAPDGGPATRMSARDNQNVWAPLRALLARLA